MTTRPSSETSQVEAQEPQSTESILFLTNVKADGQKVALSVKRAKAER